MRYIVERVTVEKAKKWKLCVKLEKQRAMRPLYARALANDMIARRWHPNNDAICFDEDGALVNGQHRLEGIILSGIAHDMLICYGMPNESCTILDSGMGRSASDALRISGRGTWNHKMIACAAVMMSGGVWGSRTRTSRGELADFMDKYENPLRFVAEVGGSIDVVLTRGVRATVARAALSQDRDRLSEWFRVLRDGMVVSRRPEDDAAAVKFGTWARVNQAATASCERERYTKCQFALSHFLRRKPISLLRPEEREQWPIEEDSPAVATEALAATTPPAGTPQG